MNLTTDQLAALGEQASRFHRHEPIVLSETGLHDGTTVALAGRAKGPRTQLTIVVSRSGQVSDLSKLHLSSPGQGA